MDADERGWKTKLIQDGTFRVEDYEFPRRRHRDPES